MTTKLTITTILLIITNAFFAWNANCQSSKLGGGLGHFSFSAVKVDAGALAGSLSSNGYGKMSPYAASFGGGGFFCFKNFLVGAEGCSLLMGSVESASNRADLSAGYGFIDFGYLFPVGKKSVIYPKIGIGAGGLNMDISSSSGNNDFNTQVKNPNTMARFQGGGMLCCFQVGFNRFLSGEGRSGFCIGLNAGYTFTPQSWELASGGQVANDAPHVKMNNLFVSLTIGGGFLGENK